MGLLVFSEPGQSFCFYFRILLVFDSWVKIITHVVSCRWTLWDVRHVDSGASASIRGFGSCLIKHFHLRNGESEAQRGRRDWPSDKLPTRAIGVCFPAISPTGTTESLRCWLPIHLCFYMTFFFALSFISFYWKYFFSYNKLITVFSPPTPSSLFPLHHPPKSTVSFSH